MKKLAIILLFGTLFACSEGGGGGGSSPNPPITSTEGSAVGQDDGNGNQTVVTDPVAKEVEVARIKLADCSASPVSIPLFKGNQFQTIDKLMVAQVSCSVSSAGAEIQVSMPDGIDIKNMYFYYTGAGSADIGPLSGDDLQTPASSGAKKIHARKLPSIAFPDGCMLFAVNGHSYTIAMANASQNTEFIPLISIK